MYFSGGRGLQKQKCQNSDMVVGPSTQPEGLRGPACPPPLATTAFQGQSGQHIWSLLFFDQIVLAPPETP